MSIQIIIGLVFMSFEPGVPAPSGSIPLSVPELRGNEWQYLKECLDTNWVSTAGPFVERFEKETAAYLGLPRAVATVSGSAALHVALLVAGVEPEDEVLVSTLSFIAPANAIRYAGAWPVFMDAEPDYWQMDVEKTLDFLDKECRWAHGELRNRTTGRRIKALLPVHILGHPVDMDPLLQAAQRYGLVVIEDATESLGAAYKGSAVGALGDIACLSYNGNKLLTTGGGGMIVTKREDWAHRARYLTTQAKDDPREYVHGQVGFNYRLTNIQAALGCAQLEMIGEFIAAKKGIAETYSQALKNLPGITVMPQAPWAESVFWLYTVLVNQEEYGINSRQLMPSLLGQGIQTRPLWQPLHLSPAHKGSQQFHCEMAEILNRLALSLPCSVGLKEDDQARVISAMKKLGRVSNA